MSQRSRHRKLNDISHGDPERENGFCMDGVRVAGIAECVGTPFYCYSASRIERQFMEFEHALAGLSPAPLVAFAVKANPNGSILRTLAALGAGADVVSGGEMYRAFNAGIPASRIVFSGVGKTDDEICFALKSDIFQFNIESEDEAVALSRLAVGMQKLAPVAVRVNPDVWTGTHPKISTGGRSDKFGIPISAANAACQLIHSLPGLKLQGLAMHVGSQLTDLAPVTEGLRKLAVLLGEVRSAGMVVKTVDVGGGLGIPYAKGEDSPPTISEYSAAVRAATREWDVRLILEPGRVLVAQAGVLVTRVIRWKRGLDKTFLVVDAAMNDLARPSMYGAWHDIEPLEATDAEASTVTIVGPVCESSDTFAMDRTFPKIPVGSLIAIQDVGAYGATMASTYNSRPLLPEVLTSSGRFAVIRHRTSIESLLKEESLPPWFIK